MTQFPGAARGDAHALVVVAGRPARGEGVAEPVAIVLGDGVGDVGEGRRALVGGGDDVGVVAIEPHNPGRGGDPVAVAVVGEVEHAADQGLVAGHHLFHERLAPAAWRWALDHEAALRTHRHDERVLDRLRLHEAEHLGAEILAPVGPADAAAGHGAAAQVDGLDARRIDRDLDPGPGQGQVRDPRAVELEGEVGLRRAVGPGLVEVGTQGGADEVEDAPQDAVLVEVGDAVDAFLDLGRERLEARFDIGLTVGVEARLEHLDQPAHQPRMGRQGLLDIGLRMGDARLAQVADIGAQDHHLAPAEAGPYDQAVEAVILHLAVPDALEGLLEIVANRREIDFPAIAAHEEIMDIDGLALITGPHGEGMLGNHLEAHVLEHGQDVGEGHRLATVIHLEMDHARRRIDPVIEVHGDGRAGPDVFDAADVADGRLGREGVLVAGRECLPVAVEEVVAAGLPHALDQGVLQIVRPHPAGGDQALLDLGHLDILLADAWRANDEVDARHGRVGDIGGVVDVVALEDGPQDVLDALAQLRIVALPWDVDEAGEEARITVAAHEQADALALLEMEDALGRLDQLLRRDLEQLVARIGLEDVEHRLGVVAAGGEAGLLQDLADLVTQERDIERVAVVRGRGEEADDAPLPGDLARRAEAAHAHIVHVDGPVHRGVRVRLGDDEELLAAGEGGRLARQCGLVPRHRFLGDLAQHAETRIGHDMEVVLAALRGQFVIAHAQEREVVVPHPLEERLALGDLLLGQRRRALAQVPDQLVDAPAHGLPVLDRVPDVGQHGLDIPADGVERGGGRALADLDMEDGFGDAVRRPRRQHIREHAALIARDADDRVDQQVDGQLLAIDRVDDRIDQERHVVVDDLDHRMGREPAVFFLGRVVDPDLRRPGEALAHEAPDREGGAIEVVGRGLEQEIGAQIVEILAHETLGRRRLALELVAGLIDDAGDDLGLQVLGQGRHPSLLADCRADCRNVSDKTYPNRPGSQGGNCPRPGPKTQALRPPSTMTVAPLT